MSKPTPSYDSTGSAAVSLGVTPNRFADIARELGLQPAMRINGVDHWDDDAQVAVLQVLKRTGESATVQQLTTPGKAGFGDA